MSPALLIILAAAVVLLVVVALVWVARYFTHHVDTSSLDASTSHSWRDKSGVSEETAEGGRGAEEQGGGVGMGLNPAMSAKESLTQKSQEKRRVFLCNNCFTDMKLQEELTMGTMGTHPCERCRAEVNCDKKPYHLAWFPVKAAFSALGGEVPRGTVTQVKVLGEVNDGSGSIYSKAMKKYGTRYETGGSLAGRAKKSKSGKTLNKKKG